MFMQEIEKLFISLKKVEMKIYKIVTPHSTKCYVGKTTQTLHKRMIGHNGNYNRWLSMKDGWCSSFGLLWLGDCSIELLEESEDSQAERNWIAQLDCVNNQRLQGKQKQCPIKIKAYCAANIEYKSEWDKVYHAAHRLQRSAQRKERIICDRCGNNIRRGDKSTHQKTKKCQTIYAAMLPVHLQHLFSAKLTLQ